MFNVIVQPIKNYEELAPLISAQLRRGVRTNSFGDYHDDVAHGDVLTFSWDRGLLILRKRLAYDHWVLNFYLHNLDGIPLPPLDGPVVVEIPSRARDTAMRETTRLFRDTGFNPLTERQRLCLPAKTAVAPGDCPFDIRVGEPSLEDLNEAYTLLLDCFDILTGCIPTLYEFEQTMAQGNVIFATDSHGETAGLLHIAPNRGHTELRHLAVREDCRRMGVAQKLLSYYLVHTDFSKSLVWVRSDNAPALHFYQKNGYTADGWRSTVLCRPDT